jgi:hypothetical protein
MAGSFANFGLMQKRWMMLCTWLGLVSALMGQVESQDFFDVTATYYELEMQLDPAFRSVAGTQRMTLRLHAAASGVSFLLSDSLRLVHVKARGQVLSTHRQGDTVRVQFGRMLKAGATPELEILYGGKPPQAEGVWASQQVALDGNLLPPHHWFPCLPGLVDSMRLHVIYPREYSVLTTSKVVAQRGRPGNFVRHSFDFLYPIDPVQLRVYAGRLIQVEQDHVARDGQRHQLHYVTPADQRTVAKGELAQVSENLAWLAQQLGPYPFWNQPFYWVGQPLGHEEVLDFDPQLMRRLATHWLGRSVRAGDAVATRILAALCTYTELMYVEQRFDRKTAQRYLLDQPVVPVGVGLFATLRHQLADDPAWWQAIADIHGTWAGETVSGPQLIAFFSELLDRDLGPAFDQYLLYQQPPTLQYRVLKERRSSTLFYRWQSEVEGLPLTFRVNIAGEPQVLTPTSEWQKLEYKGISPREMDLGVEQGYLLVQETKP